MPRTPEAPVVKETPEDRAKRLEELNLDVNRLTGRVIELERELRQARADERRARAALYRATVS